MQVMGWCLYLKCCLGSCSETCLNLHPHIARLLYKWYHCFYPVALHSRVE